MFAGGISARSRARRPNVQDLRRFRTNPRATVPGHESAIPTDRQRPGARRALRPGEPVRGCGREGLGSVRGWGQARARRRRGGEGAAEVGALLRPQALGIPKRSGLAGMTLWDPMGFGLAFQIADETDRGLQGRSSRCASAGLRSLDGPGAMSASPPTWWRRCPEALGARKFRPGNRSCRRGAVLASMSVDRFACRPQDGSHGGSSKRSTDDCQTPGQRSQEEGPLEIGGQGGLAGPQDLGPRTGLSGL